MSGVIDMSIESVASARERLWDCGFRPVAVCNFDAKHSSPGKAPLDGGWQMLARQDPPHWAVTRPDRAQMNTGILCDGLRVIDIDVDNAMLARSIQAKALAMFGETIMRFRGNSARTLLVYRASSGSPPKRVVASDLGKVEILGKGQQFVAYGIHSSGAALEWMPEAPHEVQLDSLPALTEDDVQAFLTSAADILNAKPPSRQSEAPSVTSGKGLRAETLQVITALHAIPNEGAADWDAWNKVGMAIWAATGGSTSGRMAWHSWSELNGSYDVQATNDRWDHYFTSPPTQIGAGTLFHMARASRPRLEDDLGYLESLEQHYAARPSVKVEDDVEAPKAATKKSLWVDLDEWDEGAIAPRSWVAHGYFLRGSVSLIAGIGSAGKSGLTIGYAVSLALNKPWGRFRPHAPSKVMIYNVEDDADEQKRRLSASLRQFGKGPIDIKGKVIRLGPHNVGTLVSRDPITGKLQTTEAMIELEALLDAHHPDVLFLDPLVELHTAEENDNTALRSIIAWFRGLAVKYDMAVVILHHARKGSAASAGDPDMIRGASALVGAARVAITVSTMTEEEAAAMNIQPKDRHDYFRVDGAKANYSKIDEAEWFKRELYSLDNGETVPAPVPWKAPSLWRDLDSIEVNAILDRVHEGVDSQPYTASKRGSSNHRWVGFVVCDAVKMSEEQAAKIISTWMRNGLLVERDFRDKTEGKNRKGVFVVDSKRPNA
jgi:hypothetical protein